MNSHCSFKAATRNACKVCSPLGASIVFKGIEGAVSLLHGSQGCSTYIRRYIISHFKEPIDIASSNFSESSAVFGGKSNLKTALDSVIQQYDPSVIGIATTCLSETIGDDVAGILKEYLKENAGKPVPALVHVSTPSYKGTHMDGFHATVKAVVADLSAGGERTKRLNLLPGFVSPADIRYLKEILEDFSVPFTLLPDYSETLDGPAWDEYQKITRGGTPLDAIKAMGAALATIEFGSSLHSTVSAAEVLKDRFSVPRYTLDMPIGVAATDKFFNLLESISGRGMPEKYTRERGRLIDSYFDSHKYVFGKKAVLYGEKDFVLSMAAFLAETGIKPVLCATGEMDFMEIAERARLLSPDLIIGNSKGYPLSRELNIPHIRVGFPIHDRVGGQRVLHLGYRGTHDLFDAITNSLIKSKQDASPVGYMYM